MTKISFANSNNPGIEMSAIINLPDGFDQTAKYPAILDRNFTPKTPWHGKTWVFFERAVPWVCEKSIQR